MKLMEFQGKRLFAECGVPIPAGTLLAPGQKAELSAPVLLKAQVMTGGRGKAGGIRMAKEQSQIAPILEELFAMTIKDEKVAYVLAVEESIEIERELYLSITARGSKGEPVIIASGAGGVEIENIAKADPSKIAIEPIDPTAGVTPALAQRIAELVQYSDAEGMRGILAGLYEVFCRYDAQLVEINPLAVTPAGLKALDSKVILDDKARYRHAELFDELEREQGDAAEVHRADTITFVEMQGDVALISDGAGTGMLSLDMLHAQGCQLASFCELGGVTNAEVMYTALRETCAYNGGAKAILIVLIGGFNRMDHMAEGIVRYQSEHGFTLPVVVRMCGTMEKTGRELLAQNGIETLSDLGDAVERAVRLAKEG